MAEICKCNGEGRRIVMKIHAQTQRPYSVIQWCECMKSKLISESPNNRLLYGLGEAYLPTEEIDPQLEFFPNDLIKSPNLLIKPSTDYESFCLHIKGIVMKYRFNDPSSLIYCCDSIDLLKKFYVAQADGSSPNLSDTNKFDLLIFALGVEEKNDQLKTCVAQVVFNRRCEKKPTWIYLRKPTLNICVQEYSEALEGYLAPPNYKWITLSCKSVGKDLKPSRAKKSAEGFRIA